MKQIKKIVADLALLAAFLSNNVVEDEEIKV